MSLNIFPESIQKLDYAFQPIVNIHTGSCFGYEALLRQYSDIGYHSIRDFFNDMCIINKLADAEATLHEKVCQKFKSIPYHKDVKCFLNFEIRLIDYIEDLAVLYRDFFKDFNISTGSLCIEVSEFHSPASYEKSLKVIKKLKEMGFKIAIDDFGAGFSSLQFLYQIEPEFLKIDRFFIDGLQNDGKKRLFVSNVVNIAHAMSSMVIAEGVENLEEFYLCKELGCDLVQGYYIQKPTQKIEELKFHYDNIEIMSLKDRRKGSLDDLKLIREQIDYIPTVDVNSSLLEVFEYFRRFKKYSFFPVVNSIGEPLGIIRECDMKNWFYSIYKCQDYQQQLSSYSISKFIIRCPFADSNTQIHKILELFSIAKNSEGVLIVEDLKYIGFLSAEWLLRVIYERNLEIARDQNPLTKLPGNFNVNQYISKALNDCEQGYFFMYFDFNFFKPFNDKYGFRAGDRAILLFSDILKKELSSPSYFIGHIGGDDFFVGMSNGTKNSVMYQVKHILKRFENEVESLYSREDRLKGYIMSKNRDGQEKQFPLLSTSAAIFELSAGRESHSFEELSEQLAVIKKKSKESTDHLSYGHFSTHLSFDFIDLLDFKEVHHQNPVNREHR